MNKKIIWIIVIVLAVLGVAAALYPKLSGSEQLAATPAATTEAAEPETTEPEPVLAPDFTVQDWDGNEVSLSDYIGKPIVLNFWAHWCGPCQMEMPEFNEAYEELGGEVTFLMVHMGAAVEDGKAKVTEGGYTFPVVFDTENACAPIYGINAYPTSFFIDAQGYLQAYYVGMMDRTLLQTGIDLIYTPAE